MNPFTQSPPPRPFARPGHTRRPRVSHTTLAVALIAVTLGVIFSGIVWSMVNRSPPVDETLCRTDRPPLAHVAFLVDLTDPLDPAQAQQVANSIRHERDRLRPGERLSVFVLHPQAGDTTPLQTLFSACKPSDGSDTNWLTGNSELVAAQYRQRFLEPSERALQQLQGKWEATAESPLIEALHRLAQDGPAFDQAVSGRRLTLVSDLLQNSKLSSRFKQGTPFTTMIEAKSAYLTADALSGVEVEIVQLINRHQKRQTAALRTFWEDYFHYAGARLSEIEQL